MPVCASKGGTCHGDGAMRCNVPMAMLADGSLNDRLGHPDYVTSWTGCPMQWARLRTWGLDELPLSEIVKFEIERDTHKRRDIPAGDARIYREYLTLEPWIESIYFEKAKAERGAK